MQRFLWHAFGIFLLMAGLLPVVTAQVDLFSTDPDDFPAQMYQMDLDHRIWMLEQSRSESYPYIYSLQYDDSWTNSVRSVMNSSGLYTAEQIDEIIAKMKKLVGREL